MRDSTPGWVGPFSPSSSRSFISGFCASALRTKNVLRSGEVRANHGEGVVRGLDLFELLLLGIAASIGAGIFVVTGTVARDAGPVKSSYQIAKTPDENTITLASRNLWGNEKSVINGSYDACPRISSRESYVLDADEDEYGGVIVRPECLPQAADAFASILQSSLLYWKLQGKKGVWLRLPLDQTEFVPVAVKEGFKYHHAEPTYVMLTYWIPEGPCMLPANASHQVGVGGFVLNHKNEVLVVQEKQHDSFEQAWKLPTGFILENDEIFYGVVREVKEETRIDTEFLEVIAFSGCLWLSL